MKKFLLFILMLFVLGPISVSADQIYNIDMNIFIEQNGSAHVTEIWDVQASSGEEWCKLFANLENVDISNVYVELDGLRLTNDKWKPNGSLKDKARAYGINHTSKGMELCFGKIDKERHTFKFGYDIANYIVNTSDGQVLYHVLAQNVKADKFYADIMLYYSAPDNFEVWGYGYDGNAYVEGGKLVFSKYDTLNNDYVVALAKFPADTFHTEYKVSKFNSFKDVVEDAKNAGYEYSKVFKSGFKFIFLDFLFILIGIFVVLLTIEFIVRHKTGKSLLKNEKFLRFLRRVKEIFGKLFRKIIVLYRKLSPKLIQIFKKLGRKIKMLFKKIFKKKNNNN